jgi:hypothetical protein
VAGSFRVNVVFGGWSQIEQFDCSVQCFRWVCGKTPSVLPQHQ